MGKTDEKVAKIQARFRSVETYLQLLSSRELTGEDFYWFGQLVEVAKEVNPKGFAYMSSTPYRQEYPKESTFETLAPPLFTFKFLKKDFNIVRPKSVYKWDSATVSRFINGIEGEGGGLINEILGLALVSTSDGEHIDTVTRADGFLDAINQVISVRFPEVNQDQVLFELTGEGKVAEFDESQAATNFAVWAQAAFDGIGKGGENTLTTTEPQDDYDFTTGSEHLAYWRSQGIVDTFELTARLYTIWASPEMIPDVDEFIRTAKLDARVIVRALKENPSVDIKSISGLFNPVLMKEVFDPRRLFEGSSVMRTRSSAEVKGVVEARVAQYLANNIGGSFVEDVKVVGEDAAYVVGVIDDLTDAVYKTVYRLWVRDADQDEEDILNDLGDEYIAGLYPDVAFSYAEEEAKQETLNQLRGFLQENYPEEFTSTAWGNITTDAFIMTAGDTGLSPLEALRSAMSSSFGPLSTYQDLSKFLTNKVAVKGVLDVLVEQYNDGLRAKRKSIDVDTIQAELWNYMGRKSQAFRELSAGDQLGYISTFANILISKNSDEVFIEQTIDQIIMDNFSSFDSMLIDSLRVEYIWGATFREVVDRAWELYPSVLPDRLTAAIFLGQRQGQLEAAAEGQGYESVYDLLWSVDGLKALEFIFPEEEVVETEAEKRLKSTVVIAKRLMELFPDRYPNEIAAAADANGSYDIFSLQSEVGGFETVDDYISSDAFSAEMIRSYQESVGEPEPRLVNYKKRLLYTELTRMWRLSPIEAGSPEMRQFMDDYIDMAMVMTDGTIDDLISDPVVLYNLELDDATKTSVDSFIADNRQVYSDFEASFGARLEGIPRHQWSTAISTYYRSKQDYQVAIDRGGFDGSYFDWANSQSGDVEVYKAIFAATVAETEVLDRARRELDVLMGRGVETITINGQDYEIVDLRERLGAVGQPTDSITEETLNVIQEWATRPSSETLMSRVRLFAEKEEGKLFGELANVYSGVASSAGADYQQVLRNWGFFSDETSKLGPYLKELWSEYSTIYNPTNATITAPLLGGEEPLTSFKIPSGTTQGFKTFRTYVEEKGKGFFTGLLPYERPIRLWKAPTL